MDLPVDGMLGLYLREAGVGAGGVKGLLQGVHALFGLQPAVHLDSLVPWRLYDGGAGHAVPVGT